MKKEQLKKLIKEVNDEMEKHPLFVQGFRKGEKDGFQKEKAQVAHEPEIYQLGYKRGYRAGFWKRYGEKITKGLSAVGDWMGSNINTTRKF